MRLLAVLTALTPLIATGSAILSNPHHLAKHALPAKPVRRQPAAPPVKARAAPSFLSDKSKRFAVSGTALPQIDFDVGESYAGTLPISDDPDDPNQLFFWFFPSTNPNATNEIAIWLNGGPGCSSLVGFFQENGPVLWQPGTYEPTPNPYSYTNLTNYVWIDQPVGVGLSPGNITVNDEIDVSNHFNGFWKNFIDTFSMEGFDVYITGESYAGQYIPYIAENMIQRNDSTYYNLKGIQINDPSINDDVVLITVPITPALQYYNNIFNLNDTFMTEIQYRAKVCGYTEFFDTYTTSFPPPGPIPFPGNATDEECIYLQYDIWQAATYTNPCFNIYHLTDYCPFLWNELGFPSLGVGPNNYFNDSTVQAVLHAPAKDFTECSSPPGLFPPNRSDPSPPSSLGPLPHVIEATGNVLIGHGLLDFLLFANGTLISIQNMTWNGLQGFQTAPSNISNFFVPYHPGLEEIVEGEVSVATQIAGAGLMGTTHTERGLTYCTVAQSGHEIPQYVPGAAYRHLEFLLGRIDSLEQMGDFTTQPGNFMGRRHNGH